MKTILHDTAPETDNPTFDPSNGCYHHACGFLTSWFRHEGDGWQVTEWATYLSPEYSGELCTFLGGYCGDQIVEFA